MNEVNNIPDRWVETSLGEVAKIKYGKDHKHLNDGIIPCFGSGGIIRYVDEILYDKPSVLIPRKGTLSNLFYIDKPFWTVDTLFYTKINSEKIFPKYFFNKLQTLKLESYNVGSAVPSLTTDVLNQIKFLIPKDTNEQKSIAAILTSFDEKIELLQAQNKTLEELAQTLFKEWFGKYKVGDELPEGWRIDKLEKIANHSKKNIKPFENPEAEYHHYSLPAYDNGLISVIEKGEMIKSNKYLVESNSFLVSKLNPFTPRIWTIFEAQQNFICSTEFQVIKPKEKLYFAIIHCFLNSDEFTSELSQKIKGTSSSHQRVNPQDIFDVELVIPTETDLLNFNSVIYPLLVKKNIIHQQIQTLTKTRDELLPKLMSGEIRVKM